MSSIESMEARLMQEKEELLRTVSTLRSELAVQKAVGQDQLAAIEELDEKRNAMQHSFRAAAATIEGLSSELDDERKIMQEKLRAAAAVIEDLSSRTAENDQTTMDKVREKEHQRKQTQESLMREINANSRDETLAELVELKEQSVKDRETIAKLTSDIEGVTSRFAVAQQQYSIDMQNLKDQRENDRVRFEEMISSLNTNLDLDKQTIAGLQAETRIAHPKALLETVSIIVADAYGSYGGVKLSDLSALLSSMGLDHRDYMGPSGRWPVRPFAQDFFPKKPYNKACNLMGGVTVARMIHLALRGARQSEAIFPNLVQVQLHALNNGTFLGGMQQYAPFMFEFLTQCVRQSLVFDMGLEACLALSMLAQYFGESPSTEAFARKLVKAIQSRIATGEKSIIKTCMLRLLAVIINIHPACRDLCPDLNDQEAIRDITERINFGELPTIIKDLCMKEQEVDKDLSVNLCAEIASNVPGYQLFVYRYSLPRRAKPMQVVFVKKRDGTRKLYVGELDIAYELRDGDLGVCVTLPNTGVPEDVFRVSPNTAFWRFLTEWNREDMERVMEEDRSVRRAQQQLADDVREERERSERRM